VAEIVELPGQRYVAVEVIPLHAGGGRQGHTLFVIRDETARLATDRIRRDFATNVSHELKTPLAGLSLLAGTLRHAIREDPDQAAAFVDRLSAEIDRLIDLANDLLTLSQLEEPGVEVQKEFAPTNLGHLATDTAAELLPLAQAKSQEIATDIAPDGVVMGDEVALRTLIRNLLDNAIRYTEPGGHIAVRAHGVRDGDAGWLPWRMTAWASRCRAASHSALLPGRQAVEETGGTGLGLSIVRHFTERTAEGRGLEHLGEGSTFTVRLPASES
jgi:signal transduction histidine kinase